MPTSPPRPCRRTGCPLTTKARDGWCDEHRPEPWQGSTRRSTLPPDWSQRREVVLRRDHETCQECGARNARQVDHIVSHADGGSDALFNLQTLCDPCHARKSAREGAAAVRRRVKEPR